MILVTGASGKTGQAIIKSLFSHHEKNRALIHKSEYEAAMIAAGADEIVVGDFSSNTDLQKALIGIDCVYHICPNMHPDEFSIAKRLISACHKTGCQRIVYHSVIHPQVRKMAHHWQKLRVEELLFESSLRYTILQPTAYMQNIIGYWKDIQSGKYTIPYPVETKISLIDLDDLAEAAVKVMTQPAHEYAIYELVGTDEPLSQISIAQALSETLGLSVKAESIPLEVWKNNAQASGMAPYALKTLLAMFEYYKDYGLVGNPNILTGLLNRKPTDIFGFLKRYIKK